MGKRDVTDHRLGAVRQWIEDGCLRRTHAWSGTLDLFRDWEKWADHHGAPAGSPKRLALSLMSLGYVRERHASRHGFCGLQART